MILSWMNYRLAPFFYFLGSISGHYRRIPACGLFSVSLWGKILFPQPHFLTLPSFPRSAIASRYGENRAVEGNVINPSWEEL